MKILNLELNCCEECPYRTYDGNYGMSYDSGHDCHHPDTYGKRIIDDGEISQFQAQLLKYAESKKTFFPIEPPPPLKNYPFPAWCPLKDKE